MMNIVRKIGYTAVAAVLLRGSLFAAPRVSQPDVTTIETSDWDFQGSRVIATLFALL